MSFDLKYMLKALQNVVYYLYSLGHSFAPLLHCISKL